MKEKIAVIDLGSNSVRLVLIEINADGSYRVENEVKEMVRLSENMGEENLLKPDAMLRTLKAIQLFKKLCDSSQVDKIIAVATAAVRKAQNQEAFLALLRENTGIHFQVVSGIREAELGYRGVECTMDIMDGFVVDVGGASTEITQFINKEIIHSISIPYGAINLTELFLNKDQNAPAQLQRLEKFLLKQFNDIPWIKDAERLPLVGLGGSIRSIGKIDRMKKAYSYPILHNYTMKQADVSAIYESLKLKTLGERYEISGMTKERADIVIAGACVVNLLAKVLNASEFIISGSGIRDGIFFDYYLDRQAIIKITDVSEFSISNFLKLYQVNVSHARHVYKLTLQLYDQLYGLHKLPEEYRSMLAKACLLHDAGVMIDFYSRDIHTFYLLTHSRINGLSHRQTILIALVASKVTGDKLKAFYMQYRDIISMEDYKAVRKLIAILIICDKLDRSKSAAIEGIECSIKKEQVFIDTKKHSDSELEIAEANKQQLLFKKIFNKELIVT